MSSASNLQWINDASPRWWKKGEARLDFIHLCHVCRVTGWLFCFHVVSRKSDYISTGCTFDALSLHRFSLFTIFVTFLLPSFIHLTQISSRTRWLEVKKQNQRQIIAGRWHERDSKTFFQKTQQRAELLLRCFRSLTRRCKRVVRGNA